LPVRAQITGLVVATVLVVAALAVDVILPLFLVP
jgi:hypothetical protein